MTAQWLEPQPDCEHTPNARGTACERRGMPAEMVPPDELQEALWAEIMRARLAASGQLAMFAVDPRWRPHFHAGHGPSDCDDRCENDAQG